MLHRSVGLLDEAGRVCDHQQGTEPSFHDLPRRDAVFHAPELSRFWNACWLCAEPSGVARLHPVAGRYCAQILLRNSSRHTCHRAIADTPPPPPTGHWRSAQILLGGGPAPDKLRVEISLAMQRVALFRDGKPIYHARCSTGRSGYSTKRGEFVITNKERNHRSTIYHVEMPYFMRLSWFPFWNARRLCAELPGIARLHPVARRYCAQILLRNSSRHTCDRAIERHANAELVGRDPRARRSGNWCDAAKTRSKHIVGQAPRLPAIRVASPLC